MDHSWLTNRAECIINNVNIFPYLCIFLSDHVTHSGVCWYYQSQGCMHLPQFSFNEYKAVLAHLLFLQKPFRIPCLLRFNSNLFFTLLNNRVIKRSIQTNTFWNFCVARVEEINHNSSVCLFLLVSN